MKLNCQLIQAFMRKYFTGDLSTSTKDAIISHIAKCRDCRKIYKDYAKAVGKKFNLIVEIHKIYLECQSKDINPEHINKLVEEKILSKEVLEKGKKSWYEMAKGRKLDEVMMAQSVRDFVLSENVTINEQCDVDVYNDYGWYMIKEKCKLIDKLEYLYHLNNTENENNKKNTKGCIKPKRKE